MSLPPGLETPASLELSDDELVRVLGQSVYPGAAAASILMAIAYCRARRLDPLLKPVHLVPMSVKVGKDKYEWRDVVMPGIGLYRINATRTGLLAGIDEPVFVGQVGMPGMPSGEFAPAECAVTVWKLVGGARCGFTARERWLENYATAGRDTVVPNAMWKRRRFAQLAKCAEAQALRKAFPEETGGNTSDETFDLDLEGSAVVAEGATTASFQVGRKAAVAAAPALPPPAPLDELSAGMAADLAAKRPDLVPAEDPFVDAINQAEKANGSAQLIGVGEVAFLKLKAKAAKVDLDKLLADMGGLVLDKLTKPDFELVKSKLVQP